MKTYTEEDLSVWGESELIEHIVKLQEENLKLKLKIKGLSFK